MPEPVKPLAIGELVAFYRRQRGWSRPALAMRLHRSPSWVEKIERGERPIDSIKVLLELSQVLGVPPGRLLGKPIAPPPAGPDIPDPEGVLLELRQVLLHYDGIHGLNGDDTAGQPPRSFDELERDTRRAWQQFDTKHNFLSGVLWLLPGLLREARRAERAAQQGSPQRRRAWRLLTELYRLAAWELWYYGEDDLAWIAADRAISAAELAEDPLRGAAAARALQQVLLAHGQLDDVIALGEATAPAILARSDARGAAAPEHVTVAGSIQLIAAYAAARAQDRNTHADLLGRAAASAEALGGDRRDLHLNFGMGMVAIQRVGMLVELFEPREALKLAALLPADPLPTLDRRCFHRIHQARAHFLRRQDNEALALLVEAERIAPEIVRYQAMTREMVRAMLRRRRTRAPEEVRTLAERLQVIP